jgi:hypothetical protein
LISMHAHLSPDLFSPLGGRTRQALTRNGHVVPDRTGAGWEFNSDQVGGS